MTCTVKVEKNGKILLPVNLRRMMNIRDGESDLFLELDEETKSVTLETREQALERIWEMAQRYIPPGTMLSEELLADRRAEASRE
jgi:bifunctional DNA-binding transcriptional regulator/antitoxin component of YhaV-PrlF toxin-antitoxin module